MACSEGSVLVRGNVLEGGNVLRGYEKHNPQKVSFFGGQAELMCVSQACKPDLDRSLGLSLLCEFTYTGSCGDLSDWFSRFSRIGGRGRRGQSS